QQTNNGNVTVKVKSVLTACESSDRVEAYLDMGRQRIARSSDVSIFVPQSQTSIKKKWNIMSCQAAFPGLGHSWCRADEYEISFAPIGGMDLTGLNLSEDLTVNKPLVFGGTLQPRCSHAPSPYGYHVGPRVLDSPTGKWPDDQGYGDPALQAKCGETEEQIINVEACKFHRIFTKRLDSNGTIITETTNPALLQK
ncbi:MAG: hypothetical protein NTY77_04720, partial [Elusimicrobia bacterium]|nr:hypothetical protein [Elusimicrobiota bacterium]